MLFIISIISTRWNLSQYIKVNCTYSVIESNVSTSELNSSMYIRKPFSKVTLSIKTT